MQIAQSECGAPGGESGPSVDNGEGDVGPESEISDGGRAPSGCICANEANSWNPSANSARIAPKRWWYRHHCIPTVPNPPRSDRRQSGSENCGEGKLKRKQKAGAQGSRQPSRQWEQVPVISMTDMECRNPAFLATPARSCPMAAVDASPTAPQVSHIRNATIAPLSWL
jgi:hypothetical protein